MAVFENSKKMCDVLGTCYSGFGAGPVNLNPRLKKRIGLVWPSDEIATTICIGFPATLTDKPVARGYPRLCGIE